MRKDEESLIVSDVSCLVTAVLFVVGFVFLGVRLKGVQVDNSATYTYANVQQSVRRIQTDGLRGRILDCHGVVLADNRPSVSIVCDPASFQQKTWEATADLIEQSIDHAGKVLGLTRSPRLTRETILKYVHQMRSFPLIVWQDVNEQAIMRFFEHESELPGFFCRESEERVYPQGKLACQTIGYVGRRVKENAVNGGAGDFNLRYPELCGRMGLEQYYDSYLSGAPGEKRVLVDARCFAIREWTVSEAQRGPDLTTSLDSDLQREVERQLRGEKGACVVMDPRTGAVLAMASAPSFDLNVFIPVLLQNTYDALNQDGAKPLLNRACAETYAPGSTFKPVTALAGLSVGLSPLSTYDCTGVYALGSLKLHCARRWGHGPLDLRHAIRESCNPFFCDWGVRAGTNAIVTTAKAFGLGSKTGLDLHTDEKGLVPNAEWKMEHYKMPWYPGDVPQMSIGQGMLLVTPLQMARLVGAIGVGYLVTPHLKLDLPVEKTDLPFSASQLEIVRDGMRMVVDGGTGRRGGENVGVSVSGKTGTAEVGQGESRRKNTWFIAFAPSENPTVAVAMVVENGQSGGGTTAPKVGSILRFIFGESVDG